MMLKLYVLRRSFSACSVRLAKDAREARFMNKILGGSAKRRSWYPSKDISAASLPSFIQPKRGERNSRRISVLNKLFMKYISDLLTTGELSTETIDLGIVISKVKISPDFSMLKVYWLANGTRIDVVREDVLSKYAGTLRHELTQLRVIGNVPRIIFCKDTSMHNIAEVDALLAKADFGEDFVPTDPSFSLLSDLKLSTKLSPDLEAKILSQDGSSTDKPLPEIKTNALGLEHDIIMRKIQISMNKAKASHRTSTAVPSMEINECDESNLSSNNTDANDTPQGDEVGISVQNSDLRKFFAKRMALQSKMLNDPKNYHPEKELLSLDEDVEGEEEDDDDFDILNSNCKRIEELEIDVDDFTDKEDELQSQVLHDRCLK